MILGTAHLDAYIFGFPFGHVVAHGSDDADDADDVESYLGG